MDRKEASSGHDHRNMGAYEWEAWAKMHTNPELSMVDMINFYDSVANEYDDKMGSTKNYDVIPDAAVALEKYVPTGDRGNVKVLDIGAGTGRVGVRLADVGFKHVDAVEPSPNMLEHLKSKGVYKKTFQVFLEKGTRIEAITDGAYDCVVISGGFCNCHMPPEVLEEVARVMKPGGLFINRMTRRYTEVIQHLRPLEPLMFKMESEGIWKVIERTVVNEGLVHVVRRL